VVDFTEIYFNVQQPRLKFFNISYHSALCAAANWTVPKVDLNCLESFEMWICRRIEVISRTDGLKNEDVLQRIEENKNILHTVKQKKPYWTRHQFTTLNQQNAHNCFFDIYVSVAH
jgi:hypothetical protein